MKIGGQIPWSVTPTCETSQIYFLMGRRSPIIPFGSLVEYHLLLRRTSQESINLERKSYLDCSSDKHCTRGELGKVTYW